MEEILIQFGGNVNLSLSGEIIHGNPIGRNKAWVFRIINTSNNELVIPKSSEEIARGTMALFVNGQKVNAPFWSIEPIDIENNTFVITLFANRIDLLKR